MTTFTRRKLMAFVPALGAGVALPALSSSSAQEAVIVPPDIAKFIARFTDFMYRNEVWDFSDIQTRKSDLSSFRLSLRMICRHPRFFDPKYQMLGPCSLIIKFDGDEDIPVVARSRMVDYTIPVKVGITIKDGLYHQEHSFEKERVLNEACDALAKGWDYEEKEGKYKICPYVPLMAVNAVNPNSFQPQLAFKTRYGIKNDVRV